MSDDKIVMFPNATHDFAIPDVIEADDQLEKAKGQMDETLVIGWAHDGAFWIGGNNNDLGRALVLLHRAERWITDELMKREPRE